MSAVLEPTAPAANSAQSLQALGETPASRPAVGDGRRAMRMQAMVVAFYLGDALLMAGYALHGAVPLVAAVAFGVAGCAMTGLFAGGVRMGLHRRIGAARFTMLQLLSACSLMLVTAAVVPQIGVLLMLTMIVAVATAALQLALRQVLAVCALIAAGSLALMWAHGERFGLPLDGAWQRLLCGVWFAVVLGKIAAINLIGTQMRKALASSNARLQQALAQVRELSQRDELTGLPNRRSILASLSDERARFARGGPGFGVAILDIDHFKRVNDRHGHAIGDEVLRTFAQIVGAALRTTDRFARFGGEEFVLLLPNTPDANQGLVVAERLRSLVQAHPWEAIAPDLALTCSIGLTTSRAGEDVAGMLERADAALYRAKSRGRNVVCVG